ncbi:PAB-dependent poly(A)-specific ribonuclease subunit PAN2 [Porphyridium purpureum]|uniref:PAB-dependent poly(A)-specific ribonuclease subunit PAN2 n=1 Tax=Porphyridium purpureum TaxID=35688 RepID=A0A5J4YMM7_PORPP|nr:PAB-dependent poly(A)-specific ribonuclease subunit PAN2 [Porphyridium purpureum]|eukprot:POR2676..scf295_9
MAIVGGDVYGAGEWVEIGCVNCVADGQLVDSVVHLCFDSRLEMLYTASSSGIVTAMDMVSLQRYASIALPAVPTSSPHGTAFAIRALLPRINEPGCLVATANRLSVLSPGGVPHAEIVSRSRKPRVPSAVAPVSSMDSTCLRNIRCMDQSPFNTSQVLLCGGHPSAKVGVVDLERERVLIDSALSVFSSANASSPSYEATCVRWAPSAASFSAVGCVSGLVSLRDASTLRQIGSLRPLPSAVTSIDCFETLLAVASYSISGGPYLYSELYLHDIRMLGSTTGSLASAADASLLHVVPAVNGIVQLRFDDSLQLARDDVALWSLSSKGELSAFSLHDLSLSSTTPPAPTDALRLDADEDLFMCLAVSRAGLVCAGDQSGFAHVWSQEGLTASVHETPEQLPEPRPVSAGHARINIRPSFQQLPPHALDIEIGIPVPVNGEREPHEENGNQDEKMDLLPELTKLLPSGKRPFAHFPRHLKPELIKSAYFHGGHYYTHAPRWFIPNCVQSQVIDEPDVSSAAASRAVESGPFDPESQSSPNLSSPWGRVARKYADSAALESIEGFNFAPLNQSASMSGLQNALPNSYVNALLQALYLQQPLRTLLEDHRCARELCISCELRFLFQMLSSGAQEVACESSNFTRAFMKLPNAMALGVLEDSKSLGLVPELRRVENLSIFLLEQLKKDEEEQANLSKPTTSSSSERTETPLETPRTWMEQIFGLQVRIEEKFASLARSTTRISTLFQVTLNYSANQSGTASSSEQQEAPNSHSFVQLLADALDRRLPAMRAFSKELGVHDTLQQTRRVQTLPNLLILGCNAGSPGWEQFWSPQLPESITSPEDVANHIMSHAEQRSGKDTALRGGCALPMNLRIQVEATRGVEVEEMTRESSEIREAAEDTGLCVAEYDLCAVIARVQSSVLHLVAYVDVQDSKHTADRSPPWWVLNDFSIARCQSDDEVTRFHVQWKLPCILMYKRRDMHARLAIKRAEHVVEHELRELFTTAGNRAVPLSEREIPEVIGKGLLVALDCEFVMMEREQVDIRGDLSKTVVRPARMALARVSVLRGQGSFAGTPFVDDYIAMSETPVDHLTRFSGLREGDLVAGSSPYKLTGLKRVYLKLLALLNAGCIFVGHGLKNDFRIINFHVPRDQVIDTVHVFHLPGRRYLSLRFLSSTLLESDIQGATHDSIEDSDAALRLYYLSQQHSPRHMESLMDALYAYGRRNQWSANPAEPFQGLAPKKDSPKVH